MVAGHVSQDRGGKHVTLVHVVHHPSVFRVDLVDHIAHYSRQQNDEYQENENRQTK